MVVHVIGITGRRGRLAGAPTVVAEVAGEGGLPAACAQELAAGQKYEGRVVKPGLGLGGMHGP